MKLKLKPDINELKKECEDRGLPTDGGVKALKDRLKKIDAEPKGDLFQAPLNKAEREVTTYLLAKNKYLIQLQLANLNMYFVHGYLYPVNMEGSVIYKEQNRMADLLTRYPDHLPMAKGVINDFDETQVLVEIILPEDEQKTLYQINGVSFYDGSVPISRVTGIYFANNSAKKSFLSSVEIFPDSFIPKESCQLIPDKIATVTLNASVPPVNGQGKWASAISKYDRLLGMLAFLKNTSLLYTNVNGEFVDYTPGFFHVLALINLREDSLQKENSFFRWIISPDTIEIDGKVARYQFKEIIKAVYEGLEFDVDWALRLLDESISFEKAADQMETLRSVVKLFFDYKKLRIDYRVLLANPLVQKNIPVMLLVFLIKFPNKGLGHSDKQALKNYFRSNESGIEKKDAEYIFAVLGLYYGYSNLVKEDRLDLADPYFNGLAKDMANIKFKLDTFFDRFVIESVFQFAKGNGERLNESFEYLNVAPLAQPIRLPAPRTYDAEYIDRSFRKYGKQFFNIQKISASAMMARELPQLYGLQITMEDHLFTFVARHYPHLLSIDTEQLARLIAQESGNKSLNELRDVIELDKKYRSKPKR